MWRFTRYSTSRCGFKTSQILVTFRRGCSGDEYVLWFTGRSGAGKSTMAERVEAELRRRSCPVERLDGDEVREHLSKGLTFSRGDRDINVLRIGWVASMLSHNGVGVLTAAISPHAATRARVRGMTTNFTDIFVDAPVEECMRRDVKGLYHMRCRARSPSSPG